MNKLNQGEFFIISPILDGYQAIYTGGKLSYHKEIDKTEIKPIKNDLKTLSKCWGDNGKTLDGKIVDGTGFIIYDAVTDNTSRQERYSDRLANEINIESYRIQALNLKHIRILPIHYIGNDQSKIPEYLNRAKELGFKGIQIIRDEAFGELNPIICT